MFLINTRFFSSLISSLSSISFYDFIFVFRVHFSFHFDYHFFRFLIPLLKHLSWPFTLIFFFFTNHFSIIINLLYTSLIHVLLFTSYLIFFLSGLTLFILTISFQTISIPRVHFYHFYDKQTTLCILLSTLLRCLSSFTIPVECSSFFGNQNWTAFLPHFSFSSVHFTPFFYSIPVSSFFL